MYLFLFFVANMDDDILDDDDDDDDIGPELEFDEDTCVCLLFIKNSLLSSYSSGNECERGLLTMYNKWSLFKSLRYSSMDKFP